MNRRLGDITELQLGYQHREKIVDVTHGSHRLIQGKDLITPGLAQIGSREPMGMQISIANLDRVTLRGDAARYQLHPGDILFVARGANNIAVPLNPSTVHPYPSIWGDLIAAYTFYVLHPDQSRVLPEYLAWFLNQAPAQAFFAQQSRGTLVKMLPKNVFEELEVPVPPIPLQRQIIDIELMRATEERLLQELTNARRRLVQGVCLAALESEPTEDSEP